MNAFTRNSEQSLPSMIPDTIPCWCGGTFIRRTRADLCRSMETICWPHHICQSCGSIVHFTKTGYDVYIQHFQNTDNLETE